MRKATTTLMFLPLIFLVLFLAADTAIGGAHGNVVQIDVQPGVVVRARSGLTVTFKTQNGNLIDNEAPRTMDLPHLVLHRNGELTQAGERTLSVEVAGIDVPPGGVMVTLDVQTQHGDSNLGGGSENRIPVWRATQRIANTTASTRTGATATFTQEFGGMLISDAKEISTPTDYYGYQVTVIDSQHPDAALLQTYSLDYAFLMESQWVATLPQVREETAGAAPDELIVSYCDMFPFRVSDGDNAWLAREAVDDFVGMELLPEMVEAYRVQTDEWGFPWYGEWTSFRGGEDVERLSVALTKEGVWYHGHAPYPALGHAGISLRVDAKHNTAYDGLTDALMSGFHHELFHNLQRNLQQHYGSNGGIGGDGDVDGLQGAWQFFSEGTAVLAAAVGQRDVQFDQTSYARHYVDNADWFLGHGLPQTDLNRSYGELNPYHATLYWRFLYEQCGGLNNPAAGMDVIQRALAALYEGNIVDIGQSTDLVGALPRIMDRALEEAACPFETYQESLTAFSSAIYRLRLEGGRCDGLDGPAGCGFFDPRRLYHAPPAATITYAGDPVVYDAARQSFPTGVPSSYGMDFVEVVLEPASDGRTLTLEFYGAPGAGAEFSVQLWKLRDGGAGIASQVVSDRAADAGILTTVNANGRWVYTIPGLNTTTTNRLGLVITRVDADEDTDPTGAYTIVLQSDAGSESAGANR